MAVAEEQESPWVTGFDPAEIGEYLDSRGLSLVEDVGAAEYHARYIAPIDRELNIFEGEHSVVASTAESADNASG